MEEAADEAFASSEDAVARADFTSVLAFFFDFDVCFFDFEEEDFFDDASEEDFEDFVEDALDFVLCAEEDEEEAELDELSAEEDEDEESDALEEESCASEAVELAEESLSAVVVWAVSVSASASKVETGNPTPVVTSAHVTAMEQRKDPAEECDFTG